MHQINLQDEMYEEARRRAATAGFASVDEFVADVLAQDFHLDDTFDQFFTPQRLALVDESIADVAAGNVHSMVQKKEKNAPGRGDEFSANA